MKRAAVVWKPWVPLNSGRRGSVWDRSALADVGKGDKRRPEIAVARLRCGRRAIFPTRASRGHSLCDPSLTLHLSAFRIRAPIEQFDPVPEVETHGFRRCACDRSHRMRSAEQGLTPQPEPSRKGNVDETDLPRGQTSEHLPRHLDFHDVGPAPGHGGPGGNRVCFSTPSGYKMHARSSTA